MNKKNITFVAIIGIVILGLLLTFYFLKNNGANKIEGETTKKEEKQLDPRYTERLPTKESKEEIKRQEEELRKLIKAEKEKELSQSGITMEMEKFDIEVLRSHVGTDVIDKYFHKDLWKIVDVDKPVEITIKESKKYNDIEALLKMRVENFIIDTPLETTQNGDIVVYKVNNKGEKKDIVDLSKNKELIEIEKKYARGEILEYPEDMPQRDSVSQGIDFVYKRKGTDIYIAITGANKKEIEKRLDGAERIGVEVRNPHGIKSFHTNPITFDFSVPVIIKK